MQLPGFLLLSGWLTGASANQDILAAPDRTAAAAAAGGTATCPTIAPRPLTIPELSATFPPRAVYDAASVETIKRTLTLYAFAIDGQDWDGLDRIFAADATANYGAPIGELAGLPQIKATLPPYLTIFVGTQHLLGTQVVDVCSPQSAISITYFTAAHFMNDTSSPTAPVDDSQVMYAFGQYQDRWRRQEDDTWKIEHRNLVYMVSFTAA